MHTMLIILVSIAELEITLNHQPFSDHFMNLPSKKASTIYYISIMYVVYLYCFEFGSLANLLKIAKLTACHYQAFILQAWMSLHTVLKSASLKFHQ